MSNKLFNKSSIFTALRVVSILLAFAALTGALAELLLHLQSVNPLYYTISKENNALGVEYFYFGGGIAALAVLAVRKLKNLEEWERLLRPAILLFFIPQTGFYGIFPAVMIISFVAFQAGSRITWKTVPIPDKWGWFTVAAGGVMLTAWGWFLQVRAFDTMYFIWGDWNQYVEHYQKLLSGEASFLHWCAGAGHWNPLANVIMSGALKWCYAPDTIFFINALCVASAVPLGYWLSRKCGLPVWQSLLWLPLAALNPVLSNQYLAFIYGFHPVIFFVPVILGFFIAREYRNRWAMGILFILSLLIQETVCVFWVGYAFYLFFQKKFLRGTLLFLLMCGLFYFLSSRVIPLAHGLPENYSQLFHYAHLGSTLEEILSSPFLRPQIFWQTVFSRNSLYFAGAVFIPLLWGMVFKPWMLLVIMPLFAGVILQGSPEVKTAVLQYGVECTVFGLIALTLNWKRLYPEVRNASACGVLTATLLCGVLLGMLPGSKGPLRRIMSRSDCGELMEFLTVAAGDSRRIIATGRIRGQFQFMRPVAGIKTGFRPGDAIILDLHDNGNEGSDVIEDLRRKISADPRVVPVNYAVRENHTIVIFRVLERPVAPVAVPWMYYPVPEAGFNRAGIALPVAHNEVGVRYFPVPGNNIFRARINVSLKSDLEFFVRLYDRAGGVKEAVIRFGNGIYPAYAVKPGTVFEFSIPGERPSRIEINVAKIAVD